MPTVTPDQIRLLLEHKNGRGQPTFSQDQVFNHLTEVDSALGKKMKSMQAAKVGTGQILNYLAYGSARAPELPKPEKEFGVGMLTPEQPGLLQQMGKGLVEYATAPGEVFGKLGELAGAKLAGKDTTQIQQDLSQNLSRSADVARIGIPVVAGFATGGASIPVSAAISGIASAGSSLMASGLEKAAGEDQSLKGAVGEAATTGVANAALDAATMGLFRLAKPLLRAKGLPQLAQDAEKTVGKIVQSTAQDIEKGRKAIQAIDTKGVKTYADLTGRMKEKISSLVTEQDKLFDAIPGTRPLNTLTQIVGEGKNTVKMNPVEAALNNLEELYAKTGAAEDLVRIRSLKDQAIGQGLSVRQINEVAREYGKGFKAFSDATGQPLTSVNAKLYENTRKAVKNAARSLMPNEATKAIDDELSSLITTKELTKELSDKVQLLSNKVESRSLGNKVGDLVGKAANIMSLGTFGGFLRGVFPSNAGYKTLNHLAIQKNLPKNLAKITKLLEQIDTLPEGQVIGRLKEIFGNIAEQGTRAATKIGVGAAANKANE